MKKVCNFCGRSEREVRLLITGINGYICEDCAKQAYQIVKESGIDADRKGEGSSNDKSASNKKVPKPREIKDYLDQYVIGQNDAKKALAVLPHPESARKRRQARQDRRA